MQCPTPLPWLPVLANTEPRPLRRKANTAKLVEKAIVHDSWPIHRDILCPPPQRLAYRNQPWQDSYPIGITSQWRQDCNSALVVNSHLVVGPTIQQPGFDRLRRQRSLLKRFHTVRGHCGACRKRRRQANSNLCACGEPPMTYHTVDWWLVKAALCR